jgi:hypothetical protein
VAVKSGIHRWLEASPSLRYIAPLAAYFLVVGLSSKQFAALAWEIPLQIFLLAVVCATSWPRELSIRPANWAASLVVGAVVFFLWITPDLLVPGYRNLAPFSNSIVGHIHSSLPPEALRSHWVLFWRTVRAACIVPVIEELFWRAWLMRWLIDPDFRRVPLGAFAPLSFFLTAILFASEHGPYWDVGLLTGFIYNAWMIRTKSVGNCVLLHAVTNLLLSLYVILYAQWQYWQ